MNFYNVGLQNNSSSYFLDRVLGSLVRMPSSRMHNNVALPEKLKENLILCNQPYFLARPSVDSQSEVTSIPNRFPLCKRATHLIWLCRSNLFWLAHRYASFYKPCFEDSSAAIALFRQRTAAFPQNTLCLPRSLFAASASRRFAKTGVLFIGVFLPSRSMHAWIIEDGRQPDFEDPMWVNFQPVAALC
jgi:hypothetical protein